ncbi:MAG: hypothetical protein D6B26_03650 [Spirochaetaceae bacterium]|nr:MAG: hypothetical protein D6B26_03650 [Spirochaetaceae bacterium]
MEKRIFKTAVPTLIVMAVLAILITGCATKQEAAPDEGTVDRVFQGRGEGPSLGRAMAAAKMDAVRQAVLLLIGSEREAANAGLLQAELYESANPNAFVVNDGMDILYRENQGSIRDPRFVMEIEIPVRVAAVKGRLDSLGVIGSGGASGAQALVTTGNPGRTETANQQPEEPLYAGADEKQAQFLQRYLQEMTWMVYYGGETSDPYINQGIAQANAYLAEKGYLLVDAAQIERVKQDQQMVAEAEMSQELSLIQWIAQSLNADVYLELEVDSQGETQGQNHYGTANIIVKIYETSTAQLLGSVPYRSDRSFSRISQSDAIGNAVQSAVYSAMPVAVAQARDLLAQVFQRGIRYEMILLNTSDSRVMSNLRSRLRSEVGDLQTLSQTADETRYAVYYFGRLDELEDLMYSLSDRIPGMENLWLVMTRGKTITFDMGM